MSSPPPPSTHFSASRQLTYALTGSLAGFSTVPVSLLLSRGQRVPVLAPTLMAGTRFWAFDLFRSTISKYNLPPFLAGGCSGAFGGVTEVIAQSLVTHRSMPNVTAVGSQAGKLFLCFGTYTWLSTNLSVEQPPRPFARCWALGAVAGGLGTGLMALASSVRSQNGSTSFSSRDVLKQAGKGSLLVGTVIAVQVTSAAKVIAEWDKLRMERME